MAEQAGLPMADGTKRGELREHVERLRKIENALADFEGKIPALRRETTELREAFESALADGKG